MKPGWYYYTSIDGVRSVLGIALSTVVYNAEQIEPIVNPDVLAFLAS